MARRMKNSCSAMVAAARRARPGARGKGASSPAPKLRLVMTVMLTGTLPRMRHNNASAEACTMEAVIFMGIPGSGKTTFFLERFFSTHVHISKDLLRTRNREQVFLRACLETQQRFVIDNTNVLAAERALYIPQARAARFKVVGYLFETGLKDALARNAQRAG